MTATGTRFGKARRGVLITLAAAAVAGAALAATGPSTLHVSAATSSTPGFAVSEAIDGTSGNTYIAAQGPGHSLYFYWNLSGTWYGPLAVGGSGTTFSAPSLAIDSNHNVVISAEGPGGSLYFYWNVAGTWYGPLGIGAAGQATSTPSIGLDQDGHVDVAVQAPGKTTDFYWDISGTWFGPAGLGSAGMSLSAPSLSAGTASPHRLFIATQGPNNSLVVFENASGVWANPAQSNPQTDFSAPGNSQGNFYVQGAGNDMDQWAWSLNGTTAFVFGNWPVAPGGTVQSPPNGIAGADATTVGPSHSLYFFWHPNGWTGPLGLGGANSSFSVPAVASKLNDGSNPAIAVEGPGNSLYFYWDIAGTWRGPLGVGGAGTTFSSAT